MFHHFHGGRHKQGQGSISAKQFADILNFVGPERVLTPKEWLEKLESNQLESNDLCLTFDDGLLSQYEIALPVLNSFGLKAFWFTYSDVFEGRQNELEVFRTFRTQCFDSIDDFYRLFFAKVDASQWQEAAKRVTGKDDIKRRKHESPFYSEDDIRFRLIRDNALGVSEYSRLMRQLMHDRGASWDSLARGLWMTDDHLRNLVAEGYIVGLHSYSHPTNFASLDLTSQASEYKRNFAHLVRVCECDPLAMAHPANSYNDDTLKILRRMGLKCGFRANMSPPEPGVIINRDRLELAREDHANILRMMVEH